MKDFNLRSLMSFQLSSAVTDLNERQQNLQTKVRDFQRLHPISNNDDDNDSNDDNEYNNDNDIERCYLKKFQNLCCTTNCF